MDFFEAQDRALRKTKQLVFYYAAALVLIVVAVHLAVTAGIVFYEAMTLPEGATYHPGAALWEPGRLAVTAVTVILLAGLGSLYKTLSLRGGGGAVARSLGGKRVDRDTADPRRRQLLNVVEEMAIASGVPVPEVYVLEAEPSINAFAAGWSARDAVIAVSAGALERLERDELQGVVAHEYSHILFGDCRLNIRLMGILFGIMMLTVFGRLMGAMLRGGSRRGPVIVARGGRRGGGGRGGGGGALILAVILVIVLVTIIGYIGTFFGRLIQAAISRQREFLADAAAVQFTRNPDGIAGALKKVAVSAGRGVIQHPDASEAAHLFFADGLKRPFSSALATHPPLRERIRQIQPAWDGKLETARQAPAARPEARAAAAPVARARPSGAERISGMAVIAAAGTLSSDNLTTARQITAAIPQALDARMREPRGARHAIIALLMADNEADNARQWEIAGAALMEADLPALRETHSLVAAMPRAARLGALELAATTLAQSGEGLRKDFQKLLDDLIRADQRVSLYEFCLHRILKERLEPREAVVNAAPVNHLQVTDAVARAVGILLSAVAREGSESADPAALVDKALNGLYLLREKVRYLEPGQPGAEDLDAALDVLRVSAYAIRAQCLRAAVACIHADGQLSPAEAEALRMLSLSLECPIPPLAA